MAKTAQNRTQTAAPAKPRIPWSGRALDYSEEEIAAVVSVMRRGDPLTQGPELAAFESEFKAYTDAGAAFAVANCTNALDLAALLSRVGPGDEVVLPAHTFCASAIPFARTGATLVWADIEPDTFHVSARTLERVLTPRTKVVVVVHLYGLMADMDPILELARAKGILVVEDTAQALGATYKGRRAGSLGDFGAFSFHCQKSLTTLGEGGMLTVRSPEHAALVPGLRHNGVRPFPEPREAYWKPAMANVDFDIAGVWPYNFCLGEAQCALGRAVLRRLDAMNAERARRAERLKAALRDYPELVFQAVPAGRTHAYHLLPARFDGPAGRDALIASLWQKHAVKAIVQYYPLYRYPLFKKAGFGAYDCPETDRFFDRMVSLPFHLWMSEADFDYLIESLRAALGGLRGR